MPDTQGLGHDARAVPMRVIVCGLHRTGTLSMRCALRRLGFNDCYHMMAVSEHIEDHPAQWIRAFEAKYANKGQFTREDWDKLLGFSQACCDVPSAVFSCELAELYPEAKVIILNRDPESWYESVLGSVAETMEPISLRHKLAQLYIRLFDPQMRNWLLFVQVMAALSMPFSHRREKNKAISWFKERYAEFREKIPAHRYIEYTIKDGWGPICEHLGVPIPTVKDKNTGEIIPEPFPHVNERAGYPAKRNRRLAKSITRANENAMILVGRVCTMASVGYGGYLIVRALLRCCDDHS